MKIELMRYDIRYKMGEKRKNVNFIYRYKPFRYCCKKLQESEAIILTDNAVNDKEQDYQFPTFAFYYEKFWDEWDACEMYDVIYYPITHCPFCGEPINIELIKTIKGCSELDDVIEWKNEIYDEIASIGSERKQSGELARDLHRMDTAYDEIYEFKECTEEELQLLKEGDNEKGSTV